MEEVFKNSNKVIIDKSAESGNGVLPYLPLPALGGNSATTSPPAPGGTSGSTSGATAPAAGAAPSSAPAVPPLRGRQ